MEPTEQHDPERAAPMTYQEVSEPSYAAAFAETCTAIPTSRGVILDGECPRCSDPMSFPHVATVFKTVTVPRRPVVAARRDDVEMLCTCTESHPGCPEDEDGCGAYWNVKLTATP